MKRVFCDSCGEEIPEDDYGLNSTIHVDSTYAIVPEGADFYFDWCSKCREKYYKMHQRYDTNFFRRRIQNYEDSCL